MLTLWLKPYHFQFFLSLEGEIDITIDKKFDMTWNWDKYTSWHVSCINVIFDSDPYINIVWVQDKLNLCSKILWTWSYNWLFAIKQIGYGWSLLPAYTLTRVIILKAIIYVYVSI